MTPKEMLAKLSTQLSKSQNEYMSLDVAIELTQNIALLTKLEPYHLPEITKLICGSHSLMDLFSDEYKLVCPFYHDNSIDTMMMHFREKDKDSAYYNKEGNYNMIFTSNKNPALWREDFNEDSTLLCALDRIFDDATVFKLRGESFRGKKLETISLQTGKVKAIEPVTEIEE